MTTRSLLPGLLCLSLLAACGSDPATTGESDALVLGDSGGGDTSAPLDDAADDAGTDEASDAGSDSGADDTTPDATNDTTDSGTEDVAPDGGETDAGGDDAAADAAPTDAGGDDAAADTAVPDTAEPDAGGPTVDPTTDTDRSVMVTDVDLPLSDRGTIDAQLYMPQGIRDAMPVVIFNHGFQLQGRFYASYARRMASHGIVVVLPTFGDSLISARTHVQLAADTRRHIDWVLEQNETAGSALFGRVNSGAIGLAGHSRGGKHSIMATIDDDRVAAVFGVDPVDSGPPFTLTPAGFPSYAPERMGELTVPIGVVGAGRGGEGFQPCAPVADNYAAYYGASPSPAYQYVLPLAGHNDFLDSCTGLGCGVCTAGTNPEFTRNASRTIMVSFFRYYLAGDAAYRPWVDGDGLDALAELGQLTFTSR